MVRLVLLSEGLTGKSYDLNVDRTTVGRVADNAVEIPEASISSHHCEILLRGKEVVVKDLNSTNGTFINGERISEGVLKPGQILRLGMVEMRLETGEPAPPPKQVLEQTRVIPGGVKPDELQGTRPPEFAGKTGFEKKSNRATKIFIGFAVLVSLLLLGLLVYIATSR